MTDTSILLSPGVEKSNCGSATRLGLTLTKGPPAMPNLIKISPRKQDQGGNLGACFADAQIFKKGMPNVPSFLSAKTNAGTSNHLVLKVSRTVYQHIS